MDEASVSPLQDAEFTPSKTASAETEESVKDAVLDQEANQVKKIPKIDKTSSVPEKIQEPTPSSAKAAEEQMHLAEQEETKQA